MKAPFVVGRDLLASFRHLRLITIIERQPKGIAERCKRPFGGIRLGRFERDIMSELGLRRPPKPGPDAFAHRHRVAGSDRDPNLG